MLTQNFLDTKDNLPLKPPKLFWSEINVEFPDCFEKKMIGRDLPLTNLNATTKTILLGFDTIEITSYIHHK